MEKQLGFSCWINSPANSIASIYKKEELVLTWKVNSYCSTLKILCRFSGNIQPFSDDTFDVFSHPQ